MIRNDVLHWFLLGFGLELPGDRDLGRPANITQLCNAATEKCFDCSTKEMLDTLYTLRREHAELIKFVPVGEAFQRVSFERVRNTDQWMDFLMTGYFNIIVLPEGLVHFQELSEQLRREVSLIGNTASPLSRTLAAFEAKTTVGTKAKGRWVWQSA